MKFSIQFEKTSCKEKEGNKKSTERNREKKTAQKCMQNSNNNNNSQFFTINRTQSIHKI